MISVQVSQLKNNGVICTPVQVGQIGLIGQHGLSLVEERSDQNLETVTTKIEKLLLQGVKVLNPKLNKLLFNVQIGARGVVGRSVVDPAVEDRNHAIVNVIRTAVQSRALPVQGTPVLDEIVIIISVLLDR